jgi:hypothetical protein
LSKKPKAVTVGDFAHLDANPMSPEMRAAFRQACSGGIKYQPEEPRAQDGHQFDHLNGPEFVASQAKTKADAIIAAGESRRNGGSATKPAGVAGAILKAGADARKPTTAPAATGLAGKIIAAAKRAVGI